jgi:hypothetical protein
MPFSIIAKQSVGEDNELSHDGGYCDFGWFPCFAKAFVFGLHVAIKTDTLTNKD